MGLFDFALRQASKSLKRNLVLAGAFEIAVSIVALDPERSREDVRGNFGHQIQRLRGAVLEPAIEHGQLLFTEAVGPFTRPFEGVDLGPDLLKSGEMLLEDTGIADVFIGTAKVGSRLFGLLLVGISRLGELGSVEPVAPEKLP